MACSCGAGGVVDLVVVRLGTLGAAPTPVLMCHGRSLLSGDVDDLRDDWGASLAPTFRETYQ
ncbi:hypothetical protein [Dietzia sp. ANT_WB102]|uniref:hypothetical protein n=1 Tax=Dietzia sp. ANT_WB102 TaxID=2597345 RepID=UPI0021063830|nr:hypothetical protein [Dietzia sp. ANT_WB102]